MAFRVDRVKEAVWPEALGIGAYALGLLAAASVDAQRADAKPVAQQLVTYGAIVGGAAGLGYDKAPGFSKGLLYGAGVGVIINLTRSLYEAATKQPTRSRVADFGALIPRKVGALLKGSTLGTRSGLVLGNKEMTQIEDTSGNPWPGRRLTVTSQGADLIREGVGPAGFESPVRYAK